MAIVRYNQYRPAAYIETIPYAAASVGFFQRTSWNLNNWHSCVGNYPRTYIWPANGSAVTEVVSSGSTAEHFVLYFGKDYIDQAYSTLRVTMQARVHNGSGATNFTFWASTNLYTGSSTAFDSTMLTGAASVTQQFTSSAWAIKSGTLLVPERDYDGCLYYCLTAEDSSAAVASTMVSVTFQPVFV